MLQSYKNTDRWTCYNRIKKHIDRWTCYNRIKKTRRQMDMLQSYKNTQTDGHVTIV